MDRNNLITYYHFRTFSFSDIHSTGTEQHFFRPCIGYVTKGYAKFFYNGKIIYANEGDLIYIPFETKYQSIWYGSPDIEWYSINFDFYQKHSFFDYRFQVLRDYPSEIIEKMRTNYESSYFTSVSYFYLLLDDIYKKMEASPMIPTYTIIKPAIEYIKDNYEKEIPISTLAEYCHISRASLFKLFKKTLNITPVEYKHNIMIEHAIDLISNTDMSIEEISRTVGFPSSNYFRKVFFKHTEKKPTELRKK